VSVRHDACDLYQAPGLLHRQRPQQHSVNQGEDGDVRADAERQRQHSNDGEPGIPPQRPQRVAEVFDEIFQPAPTHVPDCLFDLFHVAELEERAPLGLPAVHPRRHEVLDQAVSVESDLLADTEVTVLAEPHDSLHGLRTPAIAADSRSQEARCSSSRPRGGPYQDNLHVHRKMSKESYGGPG
jgi:hypothetical protein